MPSRFTTEEIKQKYNGFAGKYALMERFQEPLVAGRLRRRLLRRVRGDVLEVACGTGVNLPHYPEDCRITANDVSPAMIRIAEGRAERMGLDVTFRLMDAESIEFPDRSFDTVVSSLVLCTFPNPVAALGEMRRVCKSDGRILLLEHGRSDREWLGRFQDFREEAHASHLGCYWNREPLELVEQAGLTPTSTRRSLLGVFHEIEAEPTV